MFKRIVIILSIVVLLGGGAMAYNLFAAPVSVTTYRVETRILVDDLNLTGTLEATEERQLYATQPMIIQALPVKRGDRVANGDLLVRGKSAEAELQLQEINTKLDALQHELTQLEQQILQQGTVDVLNHQRNLIEGQIQLLRATLAVAEDQLAETVLRSSGAWEVVEVLVQEGYRVAPGTPLIQLQSIEREARVDVYAEDALRLQPELSVRLTGDALPEPLEGRVAALYPRAIERMSDLGVLERRLPVTIELIEAPDGLIPGLPVDVQILFDEIETLAVPREAVFSWDGGDAVFRIINDQAEIVPVDVGLRTDRWLEVRRGLNAEDLIIVRPPSTLEPGNRVRISQ